ncbi:hypothetical protein [Pelagibacterium luteolum]|uniref:Uncharacterized protein n=1 Tax=Pelagibacterium luteolum TaxID=440168 RepID=A0A1G7S6S2_9HYPH|nr:hypothetical protein [Pelagibacterium luteolum]SDG18725.1 hypothetical protein SAMN04487974_101338 [Pelagibacterium luteolum]
MPPRARIAYTPDADMLWDGEAPEGARKRLDAIIRRALSDDEWAGFCKVVRVYAFRLNHEVQSASLSEQQKAADAVARAAEELQAAIDAANAGRMGRLVSTRVADRWAELRDLEAEHENDTEAMRADIAVICEDAGYEAPEDEADSMIYRWRFNGWLTRPRPVPDFIESLGQFSSAASVFAKRLRVGSEHHETAGSAFTEFVGLLTEWMRSIGLPTGASKIEGGTGGMVTQIAMEVDGYIPTLHKPSGEREPVQMRQPPAQPETWAARVIAAQRQYEADRPAPCSDGDG